MPPSLRLIAGIVLTISLIFLTACVGTRSAKHADMPDASSSPAAPAGPAAKLREARTNNSAEAYRGILNDFPNTAEAETARQELSAMYDRALADFVTRAPAGRTQMVQFITKLTDYQKRTGNNLFEVRYRDAEDPNDFTSYTPSSTSREKILKAFQHGFGAFPSALMDIKEGADISDPQDVRDIQKPTIYLEYKQWMNYTEFKSRNSKESMFGYDITLKASLRIPGEPDKFDFSVFGRTPSSFNASDIYTAVVDLAVDQFLDKIEKTFTRAD
jgi:hypothetical protein